MTIKGENIMSEEERICGNCKSWIPEFIVGISPEGSCQTILGPNGIPFIIEDSGISAIKTCLTFGCIYFEINETFLETEITKATLKLKEDIIIYFDEMFDKIYEKNDLFNKKIDSLTKDYQK